MPVSAPVPSSSSSTAAWNVSRRAVAQARRPHGHRRAVLDLAPVPDHAAGAAPDQLLGREDLVDGLQHRLGRREHAAGDEHDDQVAGCAVELGGRRRAASSAAARGVGAVERPVPMRTDMPG